MGAIDDKYHIKIGDVGMVLARSIRHNRHIYARDEAPAFVNKFASGDPNYRDATFFGHWATLDWLNGFDQEYWDDPGKFYRSSTLDTTDSTKLQLEEAFNSAGQIASGVTVNCLAALPSAQPWADDNYGYRKQLTITAPAGQDMPVSYPIKVTEDTAALETAGKLLANRNDWRVYYWDGTSWSDLIRDYVGTEETWFALQAALTGGSATTAYYVYYDYSSESTSKEPSSDSEFNEVYGVPGDDANTKLLVHVVDTSGTNVQDTSGFGHDITLNDGAAIVAAGKFANAMDFESANSEYGSITDHADLKPTGNFTVEAWVKTSTKSTIIFQSFSKNTNLAGLQFLTTSNGYLRLISGKNTGAVLGTDYGSVIGTIDVCDGDWHHVAGTYDGSNLKVYVDGVLDQSSAWSDNPAYAGTNYVRVACRNESGTNAVFFNGQIAGLSLNNGTAKTSFPYGVVESDPTVTQSSEVAKAAAVAIGSARIYAGCDDGKIYEWSGGTTWTEAYDTSNVSVNCAVIAEFSGTTKLFFGSGDPDVNTDGTAKIYETTDGDAFSLSATLSGGTTSSVLSIAFYKDKLYAGAGPNARIYESDDGSTFTTSKNIDDPDKPGYPYTMAIYNDWLFVGGGHPEQFRSSRSNGFLYRYDTYEWKSIHPFEHTVVRSLWVYDSLLFIGTTDKDLYVFNTASTDKLFEFPWNVSIEAMATYQDKLALALGPADGTNATGNEGVYLFDRNGLHEAFNSGEDGYTCLLNINNLLLCGTLADGETYRTVADTYVSSGTLQTSYYEAQLPSVDKLFRDATLIYDALPAGTTIAIAYKTDESDASWTSLGTSSTDNATAETFTFAVGVYAKKISLRVTLSTTDTSATPVLRKIIVKYALVPDFKYIWKMTIAAVDDLIWQDGTRPVAYLGAAVTAGDTTITLGDVTGFPDPNGTTYYATLVDSSNTEDRFTYTGVSGSTLTGIPDSGTYALGAHAAAEVNVSKVKIRGRDIHQTILDLKQAKTMYTFTDIDENTYTAFFHSFQTDGWVIDPVSDSGNLENEIPITLLEA